jgi:hypothetical protein
MTWIKTLSFGRIAVVMLLVVVVIATVRLWASMKSRASTGLASSAILTFDTTQPGPEFGLGAIGLSTEARELGSRQLGPSRLRLVRLMRHLGPSVLRIGGDSLDRSWWTSHGEPAPRWAGSAISPGCLFELHALLLATGWKTLLGVDLGHFEPGRAADEVREAQRILGVTLLGVEIGNEPDAYGDPQEQLRPPSYTANEYLREAEVYSRVIRSAAPGVTVFGPDVTQGPTWLTQIGTGASIFDELTQHFYPINQCPSTPPPQPLATVSTLLSSEIRQRENEELGALTSAGSMLGRPMRIDETNSVACGEGDYAVPGFAGALWALDWSLRAASAGVAGSNFYDTFGSCGLYMESPICARDGDADTGILTAQADYYGLLAARQLEGGRFVSTNLAVSGSQPNITTYATLARGGTLRVAIDNMSIEGPPEEISIPLADYHATDESLIGKSINAQGDVTLGGATLTGRGQWHPRPMDLGASDTVHVDVPAASAAILVLSRSVSAS